VFTRSANRGFTQPPPDIAVAPSCYLKGFPPLLIQVGSAETLLDDAVRLAAAAGASDASVTLQVWPQMIHAWPIWNAHLDAGRRALTSAGSFVREHIS
jgi:epsilon-lactone hydrolase